MLWLFRNTIAEPVPGLDQPAGLRQVLEALLERAVEAEQERPRAGSEGLVEEVPGDEGLAVARRRQHPQAQRRHLDVVQHLDQPARQAHEVLLLGADVGVHVGHDLEGLAEEFLDAPRRARRVGSARRQDRLDRLAEPVAARGVDDPLAVDRRRVELADGVIGAVDQVVDREPLPAGLPGELLADAVQRARDLFADVLALVRILLEELAGLLDERAILLLDAQRPAGAVEHHEVDLAEQRPALVLPGPVHAVKDRVVVRQRLLEKGEGRDLRLVGAGEGEAGQVGGDEAGHRSLPVPRQV